jgi:hypothetical protein
MLSPASQAKADIIKTENAGSKQLAPGGAEDMLGSFK